MLFALGRRAYDLNQREQLDEIDFRLPTGRACYYLLLYYNIMRVGVIFYSERGLK